MDNKFDNASLLKLAQESASGEDFRKAVLDTIFEGRYDEKQQQSGKSESSMQQSQTAVTQNQPERYRRPRGVTVN